jgi:hypothetical protein
MSKSEDDKTVEVATEAKRGRGRPRVAKPMDAAERQRRSRAARRAGSDGEYHLSSIVSSEAFFALGRLCHHFKLSRQQMLEQLIGQRDQEVLNGISDTDSPEWKEYFDRGRSGK